MGRRTLHGSVFHQVYDEAIERGDEDSAFEQARAAANSALEQRKIRRRETKRDSARMRRQLLSADLSEPGEAPSKKKAITVWLDESQVAILNAEARRLADDLSPGSGLPVEYWRSAVVDRLLTTLNSDNQKHEKGWEEITVESQTPVTSDRKGGVFAVDEQLEQTIAALQDIIASERERGVLDADIQLEVDKFHLGMSIDDILAYEFKTGRTSTQSL